MPSAVWVGGPPCSGKTTIARRLARRHGLRLYSADTRTWAHRDRALAAGVQAARRWESMAPADRWDWPAATLFEISLHAERGPMVLDDLAALPASPLVVAEGATLPASSAPVGRSVWLLPTTEFQDARLSAVGMADGPGRLARLLRSRAVDEVADHGLCSLVVDGSRSVARMVAALEEVLAEALAAGPLGADDSSRRALARAMNLDVVAQVRGYYGRPWATGEADTVTKSFVCECGQPDCENEAVVTVGQAACGPVLAHAHRRDLAPG